MEIGVRQHLVYDESTQDWINKEFEYEDIENMFLTPMLKDSVEFLIGISVVVLPDAERSKSDFTFFNLKMNTYFSV